MNKQSLLLNNKLVLSLVAVLLIVLGVFSYVVSSNKSFEKEMTKVETISESNDIDTIEADLNATDLDNLDQELSLIQTELN